MKHAKMVMKPLALSKESYVCMLDHEVMRSMYMHNGV